MFVDFRCPVRVECILSCSTTSAFCPANPVSQEIRPPPGDSPPLSKGGDIPRIFAPPGLIQIYNILLTTENLKCLLIFVVQSGLSVF